MPHEVAVIVPNWPLGPSGGRDGLRRISKTLKDNGVDCVTVGLDEGFGDTVINPDQYVPGGHLIVPEGIVTVNASDYFMHFVEQPHGKVITYIQNSEMVDPHQEWQDIYWGLGEHHNAHARREMGIPEDIPIETLMLPVDTEWWSESPVLASDEGCRPPRIEGSILYSPNRNATALDAVARRCGNKPVFRVLGATQEELRTLMAMADIFILASLSEGQSCLLNEAMSMELACVTWPSVGLPDIITHEKTGLMVEQNDVIGLSDCVKRLQESPETARELGNNSRNWVREHLSLDGFQDKLMELWAKVGE